MAYPPTTEHDVQRIRSWTGLLVVVLGDAAIAIAAIFGIVATSGGQGASANGSATQIVAILTSAFTAIGTMTTAYFGLRAMSNTAQTSMVERAKDAPPVKGDAPETAQRG